MAKKKQNELSKVFIKNFWSVWLLVAVSLIFIFFAKRDALAKFVWQNYRWPAASLLLNRSDADLAMFIGNYYFNGVIGGVEYNPDVAEKAFKKAITINQEIPQGHYLLGRIAFIKGDFQTALKEINREIELRPEFPNTYYMLGLINGYVGNFEMAAKNFSQFIEKIPAQWAGYNDLAWIQIKLGDFKEAERTVQSAFNKISGEKKRNPWLWTSLGVAQLNLEEYDKAKESFLTALTIADKMSASYFWSAYPGNNPENAESAFRQFLSALHFNLAISFEKIGRREEATREYEKVLEFIDENSNFKKNIIDEKIRSLKKMI